MSHYEWVTGSLERVTIFRKKCSTVSKMESKVVATHVKKIIQFWFLTSQKNWISDDIHAFFISHISLQIQLRIGIYNFAFCHFFQNSTLCNKEWVSWWVQELKGDNVSTRRVGGTTRSLSWLGKSQGYQLTPHLQICHILRGNISLCQKNFVH